jgi:hypothetical protein
MFLSECYILVVHLVIQVHRIVPILRARFLSMYVMYMINKIFFIAQMNIILWKCIHLLYLEREAEESYAWHIFFCAMHANWKYVRTLYFWNEWDSGIEDVVRKGIPFNNMTKYYVLQFKTWFRFVDGLSPIQLDTLDFSDMAWHKYSDFDSTNRAWNCTLETKREISYRIRKAILSLQTISSYMEGSISEFEWISRVL